MKKFEYMFRMHGMSISDMNKVGQEGWELVSIITSRMCNDGVYIHYFKREIEEPITFATVGGPYTAQYTSPFVPPTLCNTDLAVIKVEATNDKA